MKCYYNVYTVLWMFDYTFIDKTNRVQSMITKYYVGTSE